MLRHFQILDFNFYLYTNMFKYQNFQFFFNYNLPQIHYIKYLLTC